MSFLLWSADHFPTFQALKLYLIGWFRISLFRKFYDVIIHRLTPPPPFGQMVISETQCKAKGHFTSLPSLYASAACPFTLLGGAAHTVTGFKWPLETSLSASWIELRSCPYLQYKKTKRNKIYEVTFLIIVCRLGDSHVWACCGNPLRHPMRSQPKSKSHLICEKWGRRHLQASVKRPRKVAIHFASKRFHQLYSHDAAFSIPDATTLGGPKSWFADVLK